MLAIAVTAFGPSARAEERPAALDSLVADFARLEAAGVVIGRIRIVAGNIFDTADPREDKPLFRLANRLHRQTRPEVIERALLFRPGERISARLVEETERVLRANRYLYDVRIVPVPQGDGTVDIEVHTRDTWSLDIGTSVSRQGGQNSSGLRLNEYNLLGTGLSLGIGRAKTVERIGTTVELAGDRLFGSHVALAASHGEASDGHRSALSLSRPFHALDARWAAGMALLDDDRLESVYRTGRLAARYRHRQQLAEVSGGVSDGLRQGWVRRLSVGLRLQEDRYALEPGELPPDALPASQRLAGPFVRLEWIEDRVERERNRNLIGRPEFFALGLQAMAEIGRSMPSLGHAQSAWTWRGSIARGVEFDAGRLLMASARGSGQWWSGHVHREQLGLQVQWYQPLSPRRLVYAALAVDTLIRPDPGTQLELGGDNGLRGYPLRYQSGNHRVLATLEQRFYTDLYVWQLFRIGGAAFVDVGRAWEGRAADIAQGGWLSNAGVGLRIVNARAAFSNVIHVDVAVPFQGTADIRRLQLLVKSRASF